MNRIVDELKAMRSGEGYRQFNSTLIPTIESERVIGVKIPDVRSYAKKIYKDKSRASEIALFFDELPHFYYEENLLHAELIACDNNFESAIKKTITFLPYIDNWAVCDTFNVKCFANNKRELKKYVLDWIDGEVYIARFGIVNALRYFIDDFDREMFEKIVNIKSDEYYVNMAIAWYVSVVLVKQFDVGLELLKSGMLDVFVQNKSIQKAVESFRISKERKELLKTLKK